MNALDAFLDQQIVLPTVAPAPSLPAPPPVPAPVAPALPAPAPSTEVATESWFAGLTKAFSRWWILGLVGLGIGVAGYFVWQWSQGWKAERDAAHHDISMYYAPEPEPEPRRKRKSKEPKEPKEKGRLDGGMFDRSVLQEHRRAPADDLEPEGPPGGTPAPAPAPAPTPPPSGGGGGRRVAAPV